MADFNRTTMQLKKQFKKVRYQQERQFRYTRPENASPAYQQIYTHQTSPTVYRDTTTKLMQDPSLEQNRAIANMKLHRGQRHNKSKSVYADYANAMYNTGVFFNPAVNGL